MRSSSVFPLLLLLSACSLDSLSQEFFGKPEEEGKYKAEASGSGLSPGGLTAGIWDDNLNFDFFLDFLRSSEKKGLEGLPQFERSDRILVRVVDPGGRALAGVTVQAGSRTALTGAEGSVAFYPSWDKLSALPLVSAWLGEKLSERVAESSSLELVLEAEPAPLKALDAALVLNLTENMGDELEYLKSEFGSLSRRLSSEFPGVEQRWALVLYRNTGDEPAVSAYEFTDPRSLSTLLTAQTTIGEGDSPSEALGEALEQTMRLSWRPEAAARLAFVFTDSPHQPGEEATMLAALSKARSLGVHIYPVAARGSELITEYTLRSAAQATGGRYLFLTDDSSPGEALGEPSLPCYYVTRLDAALLRVLRLEIEGEYREPATAEILRAGGDPQNGRCRTWNGASVSVF